MKPAPGLKCRAWTAEDDERLKSLIEQVCPFISSRQNEKDDPRRKISRGRTGHINQTGMGRAEGEAMSEAPSLSIFTIEAIAGHSSPSQPKSTERPRPFVQTRGC